MLLPLLSPLIDVFLVYGLVFLDPWTTLALWGAVLAVQFVAALIAFRLEREPVGVLWALPLQQIVYRQVMYAVLIRSTITALAGIRLGWQKLRRLGGLDTLLARNAEETEPAEQAPPAPGSVVEDPQPLTDGAVLQRR